MKVLKVRIERQLAELCRCIWAQCLTGWSGRFSSYHSQIGWMSLFLYSFEEFVNLTKLELLVSGGDQVFSNLFLFLTRRIFLKIITVEFFQRSTRNGNQYQYRPCWNCLVKIRFSLRIWLIDCSVKFDQYADEDQNIIFLLFCSFLYFHIK
jgi:hypothetical protein